MAKSPVHSLRIDPELKRQLDRARGRTDFGAWLREAATQRLQSERGLGTEITQTLANLTAQLRGLGTNLNQLAHAANEGRAVVLDRKLAGEINAAHQRGARCRNRDKKPLTLMASPSLDEDFVFILPQMRAAKGPISSDQRRSLVFQAIQGGVHGSRKGNGAPQVMLKITSFFSSAQKLAAHLDYISRNGENAVFDRYGNCLSGFDEAGASANSREAVQLYGQEMAVESEAVKQTLPAMESLAKAGSPRRRRRVRVTAVAKGPRVPVAGGGHMQSAIRHAV